jgi:hypothetical protein
MEVAAENRVRANRSFRTYPALATLARQQLDLLDAWGNELPDFEDEFTSEERVKQP